ncbi:MAG: neutral/alkaline non-lysosomal ceramidase N-terminal domain-containing protein, partial [Acidobacteriaceae bacterium]|nr:neutral/alkaline non-lysosomal ceramidase N-terminal domain-containing protein [Acidobacteriaceae bacterium]
MQVFSQFHIWLSILLALGSPVMMASAEGRGPLRVGAAKVDITPPADAALPMAGYAARTEGLKGIHDHIYVRAIVIDDGRTQAALAAWELIGVPNQVWTAVSQRVATEVGISSEHLLLSAVHDHGAPALSGGYGPDPSPATVAYTTKVEDAAVEAVRLAKSKLQPARMGIGTGIAYLNVNRREPVPGRDEWALGYNENGPSDKTLAVVRFEDLSGKPIALVINYAVHCVIMGHQNYEITGDFAGATSRFVEAHYLGQAPTGDAGPRLRLRPNEKVDGDGMVALWTSGAAGDQNPNSMGDGNDFFLVDALGKMLGEQVVRVSSGIEAFTKDARVWGVQQEVSCPGRRWTRGAHPP